MGNRKTQTIIIWGIMFPFTIEYLPYHEENHIIHLDPPLEKPIFPIMQNIVAATSSATATASISPSLVYKVYK